MTLIFYDTLPDDATNSPLDEVCALFPEYLPDTVFPFPRALFPQEFHPSILEWAGTFFAAYNLPSELSAFFDAPYVVGERSVRTADDSAWDRLWDWLLEDGDER